MREYYKNQEKKSKKGKAIEKSERKRNRNNQKKSKYIYFEPKKYSLKPARQDLIILNSDEFENQFCYTNSDLNKFKKAFKMAG